MTSTVRDARPLVHAVNHHAKALEPMVGVLALGVLLQLQPRGWELQQLGSGAQSFVLRRGNEEWHLRGVRVGGGQWVIEARDRWFQNDVRERITLQTRLDALQFISRLAV